MEGLEMSRPFRLGSAAFDPEMTPYRLLEAGAAFCSAGELEESERFDEMASTLADILALPEREEA
jgi:hypothetical protein